MTTINLHGILKFEFGESFEMKLRKPKELVDALSCNKIRFRNRLSELSNEGLNFSIIINEKNIKNLTTEELERPPKKIDVVPTIVGQGIAIAAVGAVALGVGVFGAAAIGATAASIFVGIGIGLISAGVQAMIAKKAGGPSVDKPESVVGTASGLDQSFAFNTRTNLASQGSAVPVGYGRLRVGSLIIQSTINSYPMNIRFNNVKADQMIRADVISQGVTSVAELKESWTAGNNTEYSVIDSRINQLLNQ
jgi:predicted phage tail protein